MKNRQAAHDFFNRNGHVHLQETLDMERIKIVNLNADVTRLNGLRLVHEEKIKDQDAEITELKKQLAEKDTEIEGLELQLSNMSSSFDELRAQLAVSAPGAGAAPGMVAPDVQAELQRLREKCVAQLEQIVALHQSQSKLLQDKDKQFQDKDKQMTEMYQGFREDIAALKEEKKALKAERDEMKGKRDKTVGSLRKASTLLNRLVAQFRDIDPAIYAEIRRVITLVEEHQQVQVGINYRQMSVDSFFMRGDNANQEPEDENM